MPEKTLWHKSAPERVLMLDPGQKKLAVEPLLLRRGLVPVFFHFGSSIIRSV